MKGDFEGEVQRHLNCKIPLTLKFDVSAAAELAGQNLKDFVADALTVAIADYLPLMREYQAMSRMQGERAAAQLESKEALDDCQ